MRDRRGKPAELWVGRSKLLPKDAMVAEVIQRYSHHVKASGKR